MADPHDPKGKPSAPVWPLPSPAGTAHAPAKPADGSGARAAGRVKHDERGNAVWDWVKETGRFCIESTSALLKRLETPELKVEGEQEQGLRLADEGGRDRGGGYDPYNQKTPTPVRKVSKPPTPTRK